jgi:hypothetical protein
MSLYATNDKSQNVQKDIIISSANMCKGADWNNPIIIQTDNEIKGDIGHNGIQGVYETFGDNNSKTNQKLYIPLIFWFNRHPNDLIFTECFKYHADTKIDFKWTPWDKLDFGMDQKINKRKAVDELDDTSNKKTKVEVC